MEYRITGEKLAVMESQGMTLWATPGALRPYWASRPSFGQDVAVAGIEDFTGEGCEVDETIEYSLEIEMP